MRTTASGVSCATFTVACNRRFVNQQGVREADFINCVAWRSTADFIGRYMTKGTKVAIDGTIQTRSYDAQDGTKRYVTEIIADNVEFLGSRDDAARGGDYSAPAPAAAPAPRAAAPANAGFAEVDDDELPF